MLLLLLLVAYLVAYLSLSRIFGYSLFLLSFLVADHRSFIPSFLHVALLLPPASIIHHQVCCAPHILHHSYCLASLNKPHDPLRQQQQPAAPLPLLHSLPAKLLRSLQTSSRSRLFVPSVLFAFAAHKRFIRFERPRAATMAAELDAAPPAEAIEPHLARLAHRLPTSAMMTMTRSPPRRCLPPCCVRRSAARVSWPCCRSSGAACCRSKRPPNEAVSWWRWACIRGMPIAS